MAGTPKMYDELAAWWPLLSSPADYEEEATYYAGMLTRHCGTPCRSLLELGSGGGNNASWMKSRFDHVTLVDPAPGMLDVSRSLNPDCEHVAGDMRSVRLGRVFDCVFIHDAICYMTTLADLSRALATARVHCRPGGVALFAPDFVRESFTPGTEHGGHDAVDGRALRYLEWSWDPDPSDTTYVVDYAFVIRDADGSTRVLHDRHLEGLFTEAQWLGALTAAGFDARALRYRHSEVEREIVSFLGIAR
jgi:SAM-dependent methyltransferase